MFRGPEQCSSSYAHVKSSINVITGPAFTWTQCHHNATTAQVNVNSPSIFLMKFLCNVPFQGLASPFPSLGRVSQNFNLRLLSLFFHFQNIYTARFVLLLDTEFHCAKL